MKHEWRKKEKNIYIPKTEPQVTNLEPMQYFVIEGAGNPNGETFAKATEALYAMSYGVRMLPKQGITPEGYFEYTVYPLECFWDFSAEGRNLYQKGTLAKELKDYMTFKLMIRQPDFVDQQLFETVKDRVYKKKKLDYISKVTFTTLEEGKVIQMLHVGSYDDEPASFKRMEQYCTEQGLTRKSKIHKEIYISDPRKVAPEKLKTTLRFEV